MILKKARYLSDGAEKHYKLLFDYSEKHEINVVVLDSIRNIRGVYEAINYFKVVIRALLTQESIYAIDCLWMLPFFNVTVVPQNMLVFDIKVAKRAGIRDRMRYLALRISQGWSMICARRVHHISSLSYEKTKKLLPRKRAFILPLGFDPCKKEFKEEVHSLNFAYVSDYRFYKGHEDLISILKLLRYELPDFKLLLYGDMSKMNSSIRQDFESLEWVKLKGYSSPKSIAEESQTWRLAFFPSWCENSPNVLNEYYEFQVPFLARDIRPMRDIVSDDRFLCDFNDYHEFLSKTRKLLEMKGVSPLIEMSIPSWDEHFTSLRTHRVLV